MALSVKQIFENKGITPKEEHREYHTLAVTTSLGTDRHPPTSAFSP